MILGGAAVGFIVGIALSSIIGIIGMWIFDKPIGIKYFTLYTAAVGAIALPIVMYKKGEI